MKDAYSKPKEGKERIMQNSENVRNHRAERGVALVPALLIVSGIAIFAMALMTATLSSQRSLDHQTDDYRISSAVESVATLASEDLWSDFLRFLQDQGGLPQTIANFRLFLGTQGILDQSAEFDPDDDGVVELIPGPTAGTNLLPQVNLPVENGRPRFADVNVDALQLVRIDVSAETTQIFVTVSASTTRGSGIVNPVLNRAVQLVYTVEPETFDGFEFAMLANNVNCIFCHSNVDSAERFYNPDLAKYGSFERVRVGTLESLVVRQDMDGQTGVYNDFDADSFVAGALYTRGTAVLDDGSSISAWGDLSLMGYEFDGAGQILEDAWGNLSSWPFDPAGSPPAAFENLYLDYPVAATEQIDGPMPDYFPPPFPDNGGIDPATGLPVPGAALNRRIDDAEFQQVANEATGAITAGVVNVSSPGVTISTAAEYTQAITVGNQNGLPPSVTGNVILTGTPSNPITIDGTVAIDGDLIVQGWVQGEGTLVVRGNVYVPDDLTYLDGFAYLPGDPQGSPSGPRTFGIAQNGTRNALGLSSGGSVMMGDFQRPSSLQEDLSWVNQAKYAIVSGNPNGTTGDWSFALSEMSLFNRGEWQRTQPTLPGPGEIGLSDPDPLTPGNEAWSVPNPAYDADYVPRYYGYAEDTLVPIYNKGDLYYDAASGSWISPSGMEAPLDWNPDLMSYADPANANDPYLFAANGDPIAVTTSISQKDGWIAPDLYQQALEYFHDNRGSLKNLPMEIDSLLYTNNAIFGIVNRNTNWKGRMLVNGALVAADLGLLVPGHFNPNLPPANLSPLSSYSIGLQLNYDERTKGMLNVTNPNRVELKRTLWNPTANLL